jgi:hypothetical protein
MVRPGAREPLLGEPAGLVPAPRRDVTGAEQAERRRRGGPAAPDGVEGPSQGFAALDDVVEGEAGLRDEREADGIGFVHQAADRGADRRHGPPGHPGRLGGAGRRGVDCQWSVHRSAPSCRGLVVLAASGTHRARVGKAAWR